MYKKNIMLCIDLRTLLREDALLKVGKAYFGSLVLDDEFGASFVERGCMAPEKRNVRLFNGHFITLTYRFRDGHVRFNFKEVNAGEDFDVERFAVGVMCVPLLESGRFGILEDSSFLIGCICE